MGALEMVMAAPPALVIVLSRTIGVPCGWWIWTASPVVRVSVLLVIDTLACCADTAVVVHPTEVLASVRSGAAAPSAICVLMPPQSPALGPVLVPSPLVSPPTLSSR